MRRVKFTPIPAKATHNGWTEFLLKTQVGDTWEIPGTFRKSAAYCEARRGNIRYMATRAGIKIKTWTTPTGMWAQRIG